MSVHGEYARALAHLLESLAEVPLRGREEWIDALASAHATESRDLSTAARTARSTLERIESALETGPLPEPVAERLRDACHHLKAHCHAILGPAGGGR